MNFEEINDIQETINRLRVIDKKLDGLSDSIKNLENSIGKSLVLNKETYKHDELNEMQRSLRNSSKNINENIIFALKEKVSN